MGGGGGVRGWGRGVGEGWGSGNTLSPPQHTTIRRLTASDPGVANRDKYCAPNPEVNMIAVGRMGGGMASNEEWASGGGGGEENWVSVVVGGGRREWVNTYCGETI